MVLDAFRVVFGKFLDVFVAQEVLDNIRLKAHDALMKAAEDGSLERALHAPKSLEQIRRRAFAEFLGISIDSQGLFNHF